LIWKRKRAAPRRFVAAPRPHGLQEIGGKIYFTAETNRLIAAL
jgi:hypothetical protein